MKRLILGAILFLFLSPFAIATNRYMSPTGSDAGGNDCTNTNTPCKTFAYATNAARLAAGDTLYVKTGTYNASNSGFPSINCSGTSTNGTAGAHITIQSETERGAFIDGSNTADLESFYMVNCAYWDIIGLHIRNGDYPSTNANSGGDAMQISNSNHILIKRNLLRQNNRYTNSWLLLFNNTNDSVAEENEFYEFHRDGAGGDGHRNIFRRNYSNSRNYADLACGDPPCVGGPKPYPSNFAALGDAAFLSYPYAGHGDDWIFENNISEGNAIGVRANGAATQTGIKMYGNISYNDYYGALPESRDAVLSDVDMQNHVSINSSRYSVWNVSAEGVVCLNCSSFGNTNYDGFFANDNNPTVGASPTFTVRNSLSMDNAGYGFRVVVADLASWLFDYTAESGNAIAYSPAPPQTEITNRFTSAPTGMGSTGCYLWVPAASNLKGAGLGGADIGANILYRYVNGSLTGTNLWNDDGTFPHGVIVANVNDTVGDSLFDVGDRLHVNTSECSFPTGYAGEGASITVSIPAAEAALTFPAQSGYDIYWSSSGITGNVDIQFSCDDFVTYLTIQTVPYNSSPYTWNPAIWPLQCAGTAQVRVQQGSVMDTSSTFTTQVPGPRLTKLIHHR